MRGSARRAILLDLLLATNKELDKRSAREPTGQTGYPHYWDFSQKCGSYGCGSRAFNGLLPKNGDDPRCFVRVAADLQCRGCGKYGDMECLVLGDFVVEKS